MKDDDAITFAPYAYIRNHSKHVNAFLRTAPALAQLGAQPLASTAWSRSRRRT